MQRIRLIHDSQFSPIAIPSVSRTEVNNWVLQEHRTSVSGGERSYICSSRKPLAFTLSHFSALQIASSIAFEELFFDRENTMNLVPITYSSISNRPTLLLEIYTRSPS